jgi:hypothetical protein
MARRSFPSRRMVDCTRHDPTAALPSCRCNHTNRGWVCEKGWRTLTGYPRRLIYICCCSHTGRSGEGSVRRDDAGSREGIRTANELIQHTEREQGRTLMRRDDAAFCRHLDGNDRLRLQDAQQVTWWGIQSCASHKWLSRTRTKAYMLGPIADRALLILERPPRQERAAIAILRRHLQQQQQLD